MPPYLIFSKYKKRKKIVKYLMSYGIPRNKAEKLAKYIKSMNGNNAQFKYVVLKNNVYSILIDRKGNE